MPDASSQLLVSVIIDNYNYGRYLSEAIDSALAQSYPRVEVFVVDDGSTDNSREVLAAYGDRITTILKSNGGQASALNAGYAASHGEVVLFLDSDDILHASAVERATALLADENVAKVHWPLWIIDRNGHRTGKTRPPILPPEGDFAQVVLERGPTSCLSPPTSGNAWARWFLEKVMPIPEDTAYYRLCADEFLYTLAPVFGRMRTIAEPQGLYRVHGENIYSARSYEEQLQLEIWGYDQQCQALKNTLNRNGFSVDLSSWRHHSWFHRLARGIDEIRRVVPAGERFVLIDDGTWDAQALFGTSVLPFLERDGVDWGPPADDHEAVVRLQQLCETGLKYLVIAWPAFWWLPHYQCFDQELNRQFDRKSQSEEVLVFELVISDNGLAPPQKMLRAQIGNSAQRHDE